MFPPGSGSILEINLEAKQKPKFTYIQKASVGSRYICSPPPTDTDEDTLFWVKKIEECQKALEAEGWKKDGGETYKFQGEFISMRKDDQNYILSDNAVFFDAFVVATRICKKLNILDKPTRIWIHEQIRDTLV
jgi:hypothetical protein